MSIKSGNRLSSRKGISECSQTESAAKDSKVDTHNKSKCKFSYQTQLTDVVWSTALTIN